MMNDDDGGDDDDYGADGDDGDGKDEEGRGHPPTVNLLGVSGSPSLLQYVKTPVL